jgi:HEAT repeat protein
MVSLFGSMQAVDQLQRIAKTENDVDVRRRAVRSLGNAKAEKSGQMLVDLYGAESNPDTRKVIIGALGTQGNAEGLVAIARKETSLALKTEIVRRLSDLAPKSKVAADYLMEIIK